MRKIFTLLLICITTTQIIAQEKYTLSGTITDIESNETLIGVSVLFPGLSDGVVTNSYGFYSITLPAGTYTIQVSYLGFKTIKKTITLSKNIRNNFALEQSLESLKEVVIEEKVERK